MKYIIKSSISVVIFLISLYFIIFLSMELIIDVFSTNMKKMPFKGNISQMRNIYDFPRPSESIKPVNYLRYGTCEIKGDVSYKNIRFENKSYVILNTENNVAEFEALYSALVVSIEKMGKRSKRMALLGFLFNKKSITFFCNHYTYESLLNGKFDPDNFYFQGGILSDKLQYFIYMELAYDKKFYIRNKDDTDRLMKETYWDFIMYAIWS